MRMVKVASRKLYNSRLRKNNYFYKIFWIGEFEGKKVNYIIVDNKINFKKEASKKIRLFWNGKIEKENKIILKDGIITCMLNKNSGEITLNIKTWLSYLSVTSFLKNLLFYYKRYVGIKDNTVYWLSVHDISIKHYKTVLKVNLFYGYKNMISVYLFKGENKLFFDDATKNKEIAEKTKERYKEMEKNQYEKIKKRVGKGRYSAGDLEALGGLKVRAVNTVQFAGILRKKNWKNVRLRIPKDGQIIIKEKGYDMAGSIVWKAILLVPRYPYIRQVFLLGKEYTGQWWLHSVPPEYWKKSLAECERWVLNLKDGDVVVQES
ncbi:hypothetical protein [Metallosphaera sp.]|uniref:hypothetical protein n=1 Tax=Metallosphaera sp. TaxID=2020860 RepID=UPI003170A6D7